MDLHTATFKFISFCEGHECSGFYLAENQVFFLVKAHTPPS